MPADAARCPACGAPASPSLTYVDKLLRALRSPDSTTAMRAAHILGELGDPRAIDGLTDLVWRGDPYAATEAVRALARIGTPIAKRTVAAAAEHPFAAVRAAARESTS
jgi:HEAT repeat protein